VGAAFCKIEQSFIISLKAKGKI